MKKLTVLIITLLLAPAFSADAAKASHRKHHAAPAAQKARPAEPAPVQSAPPVTRLPVAPDTFRA
jgi:hypothetical protein